MRKTQKRVLGFLSLGLVVAMTVFAAALPTPGAKAITSTSVTDVITVKVIGTVINIDIVDPEPDSTVVIPEQHISVDYEHAKTISLTLKYTDKDGHEREQSIGTYNPDEETGETTSTINLDDFGYGNYLITAIGTSADSVEDTDFVEFSYVPIIADVDDSDPDGKVFVNLDYYADNVCSADISFFLNNKLITPPSPIHVEQPTKRVEIPTDGLETGDYSVVTTAYDCPAEGEEPKPLPFPDTDSFSFESEDIPVPDTGSFFMGMNISKTDYLVTALIVFFAFALLSLGIVLKGRKENKTKKRR